MPKQIISFSLEDLIEEAKGYLAERGLESVEEMPTIHLNVGGTDEILSFEVRPTKPLPDNNPLNSILKSMLGAERLVAPPRSFMPSPLLPVLETETEGPRETKEERKKQKKLEANRKWVARKKAEATAATSAEIPAPVPVPQEPEVVAATDTPFPDGAGGTAATILAGID